MDTLGALYGMRQAAPTLARGRVGTRCVPRAELRRCLVRVPLRAADCMKGGTSLAYTLQMHE